jgi:hypothetical protein
MPIVVPFADLELGPASADGSIPATTTAQALTVRFDGRADHDISDAAACWPRPPPACYAGDGRAVFADAETLAWPSRGRGGVSAPSHSRSGNVRR